MSLNSWIKSRQLFHYSKCRSTAELMCLSVAAYKAVRSGTHGSWFIRVLVATFYKHSCHRDIEQLFKIVSSTSVI